MLLIYDRQIIPNNKKEVKNLSEKTYYSLDSFLQECIPQCVCNYHKGEAPYITSGWRGSVTIEAALIMPMLILAFVSIL